jgi:hypothetical protein
MQAQDTLESKQELTLVRRLFDESERAILSVTQAFAGLAGRETSLLPSRPQSNSASSRPLPAPAGALARPHELSIHLPTSGLAEDDPPPHARAPRARAPDAGSRQTGRSPRRSVDEQVLKRGAAFPAVGAAFPAVPCDVAPATWRVVSLAELLGRTSDSAAAGGLLAGDSTAPHGYVGPGDGPGGWSVEAEKVGHAGTDGSVPQRAVVLADLISEAVLGASAHAGEREEREGASAHAGGGEREERRGGTAHGRPLQDVHFDRELGRRHREEPHIGGFGPDTPNAQADDRAPSLANDDRAWPGRRGFHGGENEDDHSEESALEDEIAFLDRFDDPPCCRTRGRDWVRWCSAKPEALTLLPWAGRWRAAASGFQKRWEC